MSNKIKVGLDFDGVVAYNPFRIIRLPIALFKRRILGVKKLHFFYPKTNFEKFIWRLMHESSIFPAKGVELFRELVENDYIEAHLITARYSYLDSQLHKWLDRHNLRHLFKTISWNKKDEQPHIFKHKMVKKLQLDYFIEDNLDIVMYLTQKTRLRQGYGGQAKIYWIYNILDAAVIHPHKHPYLEKALEDIMEKHLTFDVKKVSFPRKRESTP